MIGLTIDRLNIRTPIPITRGCSVRSTHSMAKRVKPVGWTRPCMNTKPLEGTGGSILISGPREWEQQEPLHENIFT